MADGWYGYNKLEMVFGKWNPDAKRLKRMQKLAAIEGLYLLIAWEKGEDIPEMHRKVAREFLDNYGHRIHQFKYWWRYQVYRIAPWIFRR